MMKIAFIAHHTDLYGASRSLLSLLDGLTRDYAVQPYVVLPGEGSLASALRERRIPCAVFPVRRWMSICPWSCNLLKLGYRGLRWVSDMAARAWVNTTTLPRLTRQLADWDVDLVYTNSAVLAIGQRAARRLQLPHVWHIREFGRLDYNLCPHGGYRSFRRVLNASSAVITVSEAVRAQVLGATGPDLTRVIYNGIAWQADFDRLRAQAQALDQAPTPYTFALVGLIHPNKGQDLAIRALARVSRQHPDTRLLIVGGGDRSSLERLARDLGVAQQVEFWGYVSDPYRAYFSAHVALMCSHYEAMGRVTVEAMSACRPVIGYNSGGTAELIEHGRSGLLFDGSADELVAAMGRMIENPVWACQMGEYGWQVARQKYTIEAYTRQVYAVLKSLVQD